MSKSRWNVRVSCYNRVVRQVDIAQSIGNHFLLIRNDSQCSVRWLPAIRVHSSWISQENLKSHLDFYLRCWPVDKNPRKHSTTKKYWRKVENESFSKSAGSSKSVHGAQRSIQNKIKIQIFHFWITFGPKSGTFFYEEIKDRLSKLNLL